MENILLLCVLRMECFNDSPDPLYYLHLTNRETKCTLLSLLIVRSMVNNLRRILLNVRVLNIHMMEWVKNIIEM